MSLNRVLRVFAILVVALLITPMARAQQGEATRRINTFHASIIEVMRQAKQLGFEGRYKALSPAVRSTFDLSLMAQIAVSARHWRKMTPQQRQALVGAFTQFTVAIYADRFDGFSGQSFQVLAEQPVRKGALMVQSEIAKGDGDTVRIDYLMQPGPRGWRIVDVFLKGAISELATRRSEYVAVIKKRGYDGLIKAIHEQSLKLMNGTS